MTTFDSAAFKFIPESRAGRDPIILDGGLATELQRLGMHITEPWWTSIALMSPEGRKMLREIYQCYAEAGADVLTANTFRANLRAMRRVGLDEIATRDLIHSAVSDARSVADTYHRTVGVAGSLAPVEDCYSPSLIPNDAELRDEHLWMATQLVDAKVDLILAETMNSVRESEIAVSSAAKLGIPVWVSFVCTEGGRLLSGESVIEAVQTAEASGASAVLINCSTFENTRTTLETLVTTCSLPLGAYPNVEDRAQLKQWTPVDRYIEPQFGSQEFAQSLFNLAIRYRLSIVGGCCGSNPSYIGALQKKWKKLRG